MSTALKPMEETVLSFETDFNDVNAYRLSFKKEANFALQLLKASETLRTVAQRNPESLKSAIINIAAIGISLNPAKREAYLIPRGGSICLEISYMGLSNLATKDGHLYWVQASVVKENDKFKMPALGKAPKHEYEAFGERGEIVGVYCVAKTTTKEFLCTTMTKQECDMIRDKCSKGSASWKDFYEEMLKKTVIKRASKLWPKSERLDAAVQVINENEGIDFNPPKAPMVSARSLAAPDPKVEQYEMLAKKLNEADRRGDDLIAYLEGRFPNDGMIILENLTGPQYAEAITALDSIISKTGGKK
jgi:recombination protein RecT